MNAPVGGWGDHQVVTLPTFVAKMLLGYDMSGYYWTMGVLLVLSVVIGTVVWLAPTKEQVQTAAKWLLHWH